MGGSGADRSAAPKLARIRAVGTVYGAQNLVGEDEKQE